MIAPRKIQQRATKHVLQYFKGALHYGPRYVGDGELTLNGFVGFDWERATGGRNNI